jgi:hypothetical protein
MYTLGGGSKPPAFQFPVTNIPSSSTSPMFQAQPSAFERMPRTSWPGMSLGMTPFSRPWMVPSQQADELATSQLTQPPLVLTQPS